MKFVLFSLALAAVVGAASAQNSLDPCIEACLSPSTTSAGCSTSETHCLCTSTKFQKAMLQCLQAKCTAESIQTAEALEAQFCAASTSTTSASHPSTPSRRSENAISGIVAPVGFTPIVTWTTSTISTVTLITTLYPPTPTSPLSATGTHLGIGAVAGIVVGSSAATAICLILLAFWYTKRRKCVVPTPYTDPFVESSSSYPYHERDRSVLWIFGEGRPQMDGASSRAQACYAVSNASGTTAPPPYARRGGENGAAVSAKPVGGTSRVEGPSRRVEAPIISDHSVDRSEDPAYSSPRGVLNPARWGMWHGYRADGSDQRSMSDVSTLPPYSRLSNF